MRNLREAIRQKRPELLKNKNWLLHHDNAPAHTSLLVRDLLAKNNTIMMPPSHRIPQIWPPFQQEMDDDIILDYDDVSVGEVTKEDEAALLQDLEEVEKVEETSASMSATTESQVEPTFDTSSIYVGNVDYKVDKFDLYFAFLNSGKIRKVTFPGETYIGHKAYAYIQFDSEEAANKAVAEMNGQIMNGRELRTHVLTYFRIYKLEYIRTFSKFSMECFEKQRVCIEFCSKLVKTASETFQMLKQVFKEDALSLSRTFEWFARFKAGRTSVKVDLHTGRTLSIRNSENALKIKSSIKKTKNNYHKTWLSLLEHAKPS
ncbi:hypothetical protein LAZ67_13002555 [Cordylochernes scorpioides]|uniref:RRM domain-containing protein n=1 Tax=Cordylochernes scorpioides TaxID=51811 RepID=A0ABY6L875_9ARAC|nr:hypothetical protein LAZ67_13002555 [Cordylochernes scorpioides]